MTDIVIRNSADAREAYHGLAALRRTQAYLDRAKHEAACAEAACSFLGGFAFEAGAEISAAESDMALAFHIRRLSDALSVWEETPDAEFTGPLILAGGES